MISFDKIKLLVLDCDGVLSDGQIIYDSNGVESKNFSVKDGLGIKLLSFTDIKVAVVTGRKSDILVQRCQDLGITILRQKIRNKEKVVGEILHELDLNWDNLAYMGDDWNDYPVMQKAQLSACPADSTDEFKKKMDFVSTCSGGKGAVRNYINFILKNKGIYEKTIEDFLAYLRV